MRDSPPCKVAQSMVDDDDDDDVNGSPCSIADRIGFRS